MYAEKKIDSFLDNFPLGKLQYYQSYIFHPLQKHSSLSLIAIAYLRFLFLNRKFTQHPTCALYWPAQHGNESHQSTMLIPLGSLRNELILTFTSLLE